MPRRPAAGHLHHCHDDVAATVGTRAGQVAVRAVRRESDGAEPRAVAIADRPLCAIMTCRRRVCVLMAELIVVVNGAAASRACARGAPMGREHRVGSSTLHATASRERDRPPAGRYILV